MIKTYFTLIISVLLSVHAAAQNWEINLLKEVNLHRNRDLDGTFHLLSDTDAALSIGTPLLISGIGLLQKDSLTLRNGIYITASIASEVLIVSALKYGIGRERPFVRYPFLDNQDFPEDPSFPSGHTGSAFALATSLSCAYPRWYVIAPAFVWAGSVGYSRMHLGVHYPSDVLAGALIGAGCAWASHRLNKKLFSRKNH